MFIMKKLLIKLGTKLNISNWVILLFVAVILPLNLFLILITDHYMTSLEREVMSGASSVMEIHLRDLNNEMSVMENYLFSVDTSDTDFITASVDTTTSKGRLAYFNLHRKFQDHLNSNRLSGLYFIRREGEKELSASSYGTGLRDYWEGALSHAAERSENANLGRWHIVEVGSEYFLTMDRTQGLLYYGAMIPVDMFLIDVEEDLSLPYQSLLLETEPREAQKGEAVVSVPFTHAGLYLNLVTDTRSITGNLPLYRRIEYFVAFFLLLVIPLLYFLMNRLLMRPMRDLGHFLSQVEGSEDVTDLRITRPYYTQELNHVKTAFNGFMDQIQHLKIEAYEQELEKQRIREENIMLQVHPHFLLNLFHMIYSMAEIKNIDGIQKVALYMSRYFRELFLDSETHLLLAELELVRNYISVLELQYPDRFAVNFDVDPVAEDVQVPILIIHGFLENIAKYAIRMDSYTEIDITVRQNPEYVEIIVSDDGPGIPEEMLEAINAGQAVEKKDGRHIGLSNLRERLKLQYGEKAYMQVYSEEDMGTSIVVRIPWKEEEHEGTVGG